MIIASSAFNFRYGNQIHLPYSIACIASYLRYSWNGEYLEFLPTFVDRINPEKIADKCLLANVFLGSVYVWNEQITLATAKAIKEKNPECIIILGGPQIPENDPKPYLLANPFIDAIVHNEGEKRLVSALPALLAHEHPKIHGVSTQHKVEGGDGFERILDLESMPSPYLSGMMNTLAPSPPDGAQWCATWETDRGCPYSCTFCSWGSAVGTKIKQFNLDRLYKEIEWFSEHEIEYIDCGNANFGIFNDRDLSIAKHMAEVSMSTGYPKTFRQSWAKGASNKIIPIANELKKAGLLTAVGMAVESLDSITLKTIKRKNMQFDSFNGLVNEFNEQELPTYTEIIRALPGETVTSFKRGLCQAVDSGVGAIYIYNCCLLPNTEMYSVEYMMKHSIKTIKSPIFLAHSMIGEENEYERIVVSTATATTEDVKEMCLWSWAVTLFLNLGILDIIRKEIPVTTEYFITRILEYCNQNPGSCLGLEYVAAKQWATNGLSGHGWGVVDYRFGKRVWPIEEVSWLRLIYAQSLYGLLFFELCNFVRELYDELNFDEFSIHDLVQRQINSLVLYDNNLDLDVWTSQTMWHGRRRHAFKKSA